MVKWNLLWRITMVMAAATGKIDAGELHLVASGRLAVYVLLNRNHQRKIILVEDENPCASYPLGFPK